MVEGRIIIEIKQRERKPKLVEDALLAFILTLRQARAVEASLFDIKTEYVCSTIQH